MIQDTGASADAETGSRASTEPVSRLGPSGFDPARNEPEWLALARDTILAVAFQRGTRSEFVVGKDGRVRLGCIDLLGMYAVDEIARKWAAYLGVEFPDNLPNCGEAEAMRIMGQRGNWRDAIAMEARQGTDPQGLDGEAATARAEGIAQ